MGGLLAQAGHSVVFVGRKWNIEAIRQQGIRISGCWGEHQAGPQPAYETVDEIPAQQRAFDQIILCVKAFDTGRAIQDCLPLLGEQTLILSVQNGYGNCQTIADAIGWQRTLGARIITGVEISQPGAVNVTVHADSVRLGHYQNSFPMERLETFAQQMRDAGIPTEATDRLESYIWAKILYNAALNPLGAQLGVTYGALAENQETRSIMNYILDEAFSVIHSKGFPQFWPSAEAYRKAFYEQMVPVTASHFPSMLRDLERGRRTEIDALNGAICRLGAEEGIETPVNQTITALMHMRESKPAHD